MAASVSAAAFSGFLVTGGLDHIRQPANGQPLHGRLPFTPARVPAYGEDWERDEPVLFCEGEVTQARQGGEALRLTRRIETPVGATAVTIHDTVENLGPWQWPQESLYHFNLGYPAIADGTVVEGQPPSARPAARAGRCDAVREPVLADRERQRGRLRCAHAASQRETPLGELCLGSGDTASPTALA